MQSPARPQLANTHVIDTLCSPDNDPFNLTPACATEDYCELLQDPKQMRDANNPCVWPPTDCFSLGDDGATAQQLAQGSLQQQNLTFGTIGATINTGGGTQQQQQQQQYYIHHQQQQQFTAQTTAEAPFASRDTAGTPLQLHPPVECQPIPMDFCWPPNAMHPGAIYPPGAPPGVLCCPPPPPPIAAPPPVDVQMQMPLMTPPMMNPAMMHCGQSALLTGPMVPCDDSGCELDVGAKKPKTSQQQRTNSKKQKQKTPELVVAAAAPPDASGITVLPPPTLLPAGQHQQQQTVQPQQQYIVSQQCYPPYGTTLPAPPSAVAGGPLPWGQPPAAAPQPVQGGYVLSPAGYQHNPAVGLPPGMMYFAYNPAQFSLIGSAAGAPMMNQLPPQFIQQQQPQMVHMAAMQGHHHQIQTASGMMMVHHPLMKQQQQQCVVPTPTSTAGAGDLTDAQICHTSEDDSDTGLRQLSNTGTSSSSLDSKGRGVVKKSTRRNPPTAKNSRLGVANGGVKKVPAGVVVQPGGGLNINNTSADLQQQRMFPQQTQFVPPMGHPSQMFPPRMTLTVGGAPAHVQPPPLAMQQQAYLPPQHMPMPPVLGMKHGSGPLVVPRVPSASTAGLQGVFPSSSGSAGNLTTVGVIPPPPPGAALVVPRFPLVPPPAGGHRHAHHHHHHHGAGTAVGSGSLISTVHSSKMARQACLERYRAKKAQRSNGKTIRYAMRKMNADRRPRVKGRFVKAAEAADLLNNEAGDDLSA